METTKTTITITALLLLTLTSGCHSTGSRFAWWNPGTPADAPSAVAHSAPQLPSERFASDGSSAAPLAGADNEGAKPKLSPGALASAPKADYSSSIFPSSPPASTKPAGIADSPATTPDLPSASIAMAPQTGPYSAGSPAPSGLAANAPPSSPTPTPPSTNLLPVATPSPSPSPDRYAAMPNDRYAAPTDRYAMPEMMPVSPAVPVPSGPPTVASSNTGPIPKPTGGATSIDRFSRYSLTAPAGSPGATASLPAPPGEDNAANRVASSVSTPVTPGGYRPGGTSSYPTTQASAVNIATRPAGTESPSVYSKPNAETSTSPSYR